MRGSWRLEFPKYFLIFNSILQVSFLTEFLIEVFYKFLLCSYAVRSVVETNRGRFSIWCKKISEASSKNHPWMRRQLLPNVLFWLWDRWKELNIFSFFHCADILFLWVRNSLQKFDRKVGRTFPMFLPVRFPWVVLGVYLYLFYIVHAIYLSSWLLLCRGLSRNVAWCVTTQNACL